MRFLILLLINFSWLLTWANDEILTVGHSTRFNNVSSVWIQSPKILTAEAVGNGVIIQARNPGVSTIRLGTLEKTIRVVTANGLSNFQKLTKLSQKIIGIQIDWINEFPCVDGAIYSIQDYRKILDSMQKSVDWRVCAKLSNTLIQEIENEISQQLPTASSVFPLVLEQSLKVFVKDESLIATWKPLLNKFGVSVEVEKNSIANTPVVRVEIAIAEIRRNRTQDLGVKLPNAVSAQILPGNQWQRQNLDVTAKAFEQNGIARVLARPNIICKSGESADFMAGGEFPIKIVQSKYAQNIIWKNYGIQLKVKPLIDRAKRISIDLQTEISSIDPSRSVDGIPALLINKSSTHFFLKRPQTIILSGMIKHEDSHNKEGLLGLSSIPILGSLFSSQEWKKNLTELVILVRPELMEEQ